MVADALIIIEEIAAAVQNWLAVVDLDPLWVERGVTVDDGDLTGFDERARMPGPVD